MVGAQKPGAASPAGSARQRRQRQNVTGDLVEALIEDAAKADAFLLAFEAGLERVHVHRQTPFAPHIIPRVFVGRDDVFGFETQNTSQFSHKIHGVPFAITVGMIFAREQRGIVPDGLAVLAPIASESPARQGFARIPFSLAEMQQAAVGKFLLLPAHQVFRKFQLFRPNRREIPFRAIHVVN